MMVRKLWERWALEIEKEGIDSGSEKMKGQDQRLGRGSLFPSKERNRRVDGAFPVLPGQQEVGMDPSLVFSVIKGSSVLRVRKSLNG